MDSPISLAAGVSVITMMELVYVDHIHLGMYRRYVVHVGGASKSDSDN